MGGRFPKEMIQVALAVAGFVMYFGIGWPLGLYTMVGAAVWYVATRRAPSPSESHSARDEKGLPVVEWTDEYRVPRAFGSSRVEQVQRRCSIFHGADGVPYFVIESITDKSGRFLPFGGVIAADSLRAAKKALGIESAAPKINGCLWNELQAFVLTNGNEKFGARAEKPDTYIFADMGGTWGEAFVSVSEDTPAAVSSLHRELTREFIHERPEHLKRLAAEDRQARNAAAGKREKII